MKTIKFRNIKAEEIDLRVGSTKKEDPKDKNSRVIGFQLLAYKDARVDADILDETVSSSNWACRYYQVKNTMICSVGINVNYDDESKEPLWIWKDDAGDESNEEAVKGEASDSFKRGCFRWGIARKNLYNFPFVWIKVDVEKENTPLVKYKVSKINFNEDDIPNEIIIINDKTKQVVFSYGSNIKVANSGVSSENKGALSSDLTKELKDLGVSLEQVAIYCKTKAEKLTDAELQFAIKAIKQKRGKQ